MAPSKSVVQNLPVQEPPDVDLPPFGAENKEKDTSAYGRKLMHHSCISVNPFLFELESRRGSEAGRNMMRIIMGRTETTAEDLDVSRS